ncbi:MAG TPA: T9SS type A sorting domain-containing protein [Chitinophagales bacterium]|nr:T9SS type A sorting domain-containing protein [Chitinophagales bacterium]
MWKNFLFITITLLLLLHFSNSSAQQFVWARQAPAAYYIHTGDVASDRWGNIYDAGYFYDSISFSTTTLHATSTAKSFLAKYNALGELQWAKVFDGGFDQEDCYSLACDSSGDVYMHVLYEGAVHVGNYTLIAPDFVFSFYVVKLDSNGSVTWVRDIQPDESQMTSTIGGGQITCDKGGNIYYCCGLAGEANINGTLYSSGTTTNGLFGKISYSGDFEWVNNIDGTANIYPSHLSCDATGNVIFCGNFGHPSVPFSGLQADFPAQTLSSIAYVDLFVAAYDSSGNNLWTGSDGSAYFDRTTGIGADAAGNVYVSGALGSNASVHKFDNNGILVWKELVSSSSSFDDIAVQSDGDCYLIIHVSYDANFDFDGQTYFVKEGSSTLFKISNAGNVKWYKPIKSSFPLWRTRLSKCGENGVVLNGINVNSLMMLDRNMLYNGNGDYSYYAFLALLCDTDFTSASGNLLTGIIYDDDNLDCLTDSTEEKLSGMPVIGMPGPFFASSSQDGSYKLPVDVGNYSITQPTTNSHAYIMTHICPVSNQYLVSVAGTNQTISGYNFANDFQDCTFTNLDFPGTWSTCGVTKTTNLTFCNAGSISAPQTLVTLTYPALLIPISSSPPWFSYDPVDSLVTFVFDNLPVDTCIVIQLIDSMACHCPQDDGMSFSTVAAISPSNICYPEDSIYNIQYRIDYDYCFGSISSEADDPSFHVFPNPTAGVINIEMSSGESGTVNILDIYGKTIWATPNRSGSKILSQLDLSDLPDGCYFLRFETDSMRWDVKVIIQH